MTVIGISVDDAEASRRLARRERIDFALLSDAALEVSRRYVGVDSNDLSVPGAVLIGRDGRVAYRRISSDKADRPSTAELLAAIDAAFGAPAGAPGLRGGYAPVERLQVGGWLGGGAIGGGGGERRGAAVAGLSVLYPVGRHVLAGAAVGGELPGGRLELDGAVALRLPFLDDLAAAQLAGRGGFATGDLRGWQAGARASLSFAARPGWAFGVGVGVTVHRLGADPDDEIAEVTLTVEVTRLLQVRAAW